MKAEAANDGTRYRRAVRGLRGARENRCDSASANECPACTRRHALTTVRTPRAEVGTHRRITFEDRLAYERRMREGQKAALQRPSDNANELGLDY